MFSTDSVNEQFNNMNGTGSLRDHKLGTVETIKVLQMESHKEYE